MSKGWYGNKYEHSLASKGIKTLGYNTKNLLNVFQNNEINIYNSMRGKNIENLINEFIKDENILKELRYRLTQNLENYEDIGFDENTFWITTFDETLETLYDNPKLKNKIDSILLKHGAMVNADDWYFSGKDYRIIRKIDGKSVKFAIRDDLNDWLWRGVFINYEEAKQ